MSTNVVRIRAGSLPAQDTRQECRAIHRITHTSTPPEREYAAYDRDPKARALFWWAVIGLYACAVSLVAYLIN